MKSSTTTLISALRILARDIQSEDGVANAAIAEAADRLDEMSREIHAARTKLETIEGIIDDSHKSAHGKLHAIIRLLTLEGGECGYWAREMSQWTPEVVASRDTIDAARKEAQP